MKHIFEPASLNEILQRIDNLKPDTQRQWGTMHVAQMLSHCSNIIEIGLGEKKGTSNFISKLIGPLFKSQMTNEKPFKQGLPTDPASIVPVDEKDFEQEKSRLVNTVKKLASKKDSTETPPKHPFFGKMTYQDWSRATYKHLDHHLRQFNV